MEFIRLFSEVFLVPFPYVDSNGDTVGDWQPSSQTNLPGARIWWKSIATGEPASSFIPWSWHKRMDSSGMVEYFLLVDIPNFPLKDDIGDWVEISVASGLNTAGTALSQRIIIIKKSTLVVDISALATEANATTNKNSLDSHLSDQDVTIGDTNSKVSIPDNFKADISALATEANATVNFDTLFALVTTTITQTTEAALRVAFLGASDGTRTFEDFMKILSSWADGKFTYDSSTGKYEFFDYDNETVLFSTTVTADSVITTRVRDTL